MNLVYKLFSYIITLPIKKVAIGNGSNCFLYIKKGEYYLEAENAVYSAGKRYTALDLPLKNLQNKNFKIEQVLVLGWGIGSFERLWQLYFPNRKISIDAVEKEKIFIELSRKYFPLWKHVQYIEADAYCWTMNMNKTYDLIIIDVFIDQEIPEILDDELFLTTIKNHLENHGQVWLNRLYYNQDSSNRHNQYFEKTFSKLFPNHEVLIKGQTQVWIGYK